MKDAESKPGNADLRQAVVLLPVSALMLVFGFAGGALEADSADAAYGPLGAILLMGGGIIGAIGLFRLIQGLRARLQ